MDKNIETPILSKYLKLYQDQPNSLAFAPLAEAYRKIGDHEKAFAILKKGLREHPQYAFGYYILSSCYFDKREYSLAYTTLKPFAYQYRDNLKFQELFAEICMQLDEKLEALESYKNVLFLSPKNKIIQRKVHDLEESLDISTISNNDSESTSKTKNSWNFKVNDTAADENVDSWVQVNLSLSNNESQLKNDDFSDIKILDTKTPAKAAKEKSEKELLITHTLVDLYISQGHKDRAIEILKKILTLDPDDSRTKQRLHDLQDNLPIDFSEESKEIKIEHQYSEPVLVSADTIKEKIKHRFELFLEFIREEKEAKKYIGH
jgi:tetratricopeptide (TPR) repeat protein